MSERLPFPICQILIADIPVGAEVTTPLMETNAASFRAAYPDSPYHLYLKEELADFIAQHFPAVVARAFHALKPQAFKADLARYCLLHQLGGLYSDLSYLHLRGIEPPAGTQMVVFRDIPGHPSWAVSNALIYAKPGDAVLEHAIDRIVRHHKQGFTGVHPLEITGPYLFGRVLAECADWREIVFGESRLLSVEPSGRANIVKVLPASGEVVAIRNKARDGQISDLIATGGNDYIRLWEEGQVWDKGKPRWPALMGKRQR